MPKIRSLLSPLSAAVLTIAAFDTASAQTVVATANVRPATRSAWNAVAEPRQRALASYRLDGAQQGIPAQVTIADSAGTLVAFYRTRGGHTDRPMTIEVADSDILLQAQTPRGPLTLVLYQQNDPDAAGPFVGAWSLGSRQGELRGRAQR
ncbi:MAG TPA: hypothetical protein VM033_01540 [Gemmatimonadaceae bacterium]|nr:hypothetical protein [Gemmatimonadaceae bacterium]